jgi:CubicO group peptidase (beta-lactamase class C family)
MVTERSMAATGAVFLIGRERESVMVKKAVCTILTGLFLVFYLSLCNPDDPVEVDYTPINNDDGWTISTAAEQGLDEEKLKTVYENAGELSNLYSLLIVRNDCLIGEAYFNGSGINSANRTASVTKSYTSALTGIAIREGFIQGVEQRMKAFFPEYAWNQMDPRKSQIHIRHMLQMRSGYPWEERTDYMDILFSTPNWLPFIEQFPLLNDPGSEFGYSNFTAHMMAVIIARAVGTNLKDFAEIHLFDPLKVTVRYWPQDYNGYYYGSGDITFTARDMARFGLLYLHKGRYNGIQIIPENWVNDSFKIYSEITYGYEILDSIREIKYGYLWWSGRSGEHRFNFAWGNGGQLICVLDDLNMVIVTTAEHLGIQLGDNAWAQHKRVLELVGDFITSL